MRRVFDGCGAGDGVEERLRRWRETQEGEWGAPRAVDLTDGVASAPVFHPSAPPLTPLPLPRPDVTIHPTDSDHEPPPSPTADLVRTLQDAAAAAAAARQGPDDLFDRSTAVPRQKRSARGARPRDMRGAMEKLLGPGEEEDKEGTEDE